MSACTGSSESYFSYFLQLLTIWEAYLWECLLISFFKNRSSLCLLAHNERCCPQNRGSGQGHTIPVLSPAHWAAQPQHKNQLQALTVQHLLTERSLPSACGTAGDDTTKPLQVEFLWCRQQGFSVKGFSILRSGFLPASQCLFHVHCNLPSHQEKPRERSF